jgi:hypothetical protein
LARISTYVIDGSIVDGDKVIGSDANNSMITKNYTVGDLAAYIGHSIGNNLLVPYINANDDVDLGSFNLTANSIIVGNQLILGGTAGLPGQVLMSNGSGSPASWTYNIGSQTLRDVLIQGNTGNKNLILSNTTTSTIALDLEKLYGANVGLYVFDNLLNSSSALFPNKLDVQESSLNKTASYSASGIRYSSNGNNIDVNPNSYANQTLLYPSSSGVLITSVNGTPADLTGNVTIPISTGTVTSVAVTPSTGISASVVDSTTTPNITITNTAPDQVVSLASGTGISVTGTYPSFTIATTGSGTVPTLQEVTDAGSTTTNTISVAALNLSGTISINLSASDNGILFNSPTTATDVLKVTDNSLKFGSGIYPYFEISCSTVGNVNLTAPGTSGTIPISVNGNTADINGEITIPVGTGTVTGTGTANFISKWSSSSDIGDSILQQVGSDTIEINSNSGGSNTFLTLNTTGVSATSTIISFKQNNIQRYIVAKDSINDFRIAVYDTAGSYLGDGFKITANSLNVTLPSLAGTATRMVVTDSFGGLSTLPVPSETSPLTTKGDLYTFSSVDARLGVGVNGEVLIADSSTTTGLRWGTVTGFTRSINSISTNTTAAAASGTDYVYLVSGTTTITLPTAVGNTNRYTIKRTGSNTVSIATTSSQTIDGSTSPITINVQYVSLDFISDGSNWNII